MRTRSSIARHAAFGVFLFALLSAPAPALSHCDGLDGPVVTAARAAIEKADVTPVLAWVRPEDEAEIRATFARTLAVRKLSPEARELADLYFFETLVRVHRWGEGAPYTGLKPAGQDLGPVIPAADHALETGSPEALIGLLTGEVRDGVLERFRRAVDARPHRSQDVLAGRRFVAAYVGFIHYVEGVHQATAAAAEGHAEEAPAEGHIHH